MNTFILQKKINKLHQAAYRILHIECSGDYLYADDLSLLNKNIHEQINELYSQQAETLEQEGALCLALLLGYSVSMYASAEDDLKRQTILTRSENLLELLPPSSLTQDLSAICQEYAKV